MSDKKNLDKITDLNLSKVMSKLAIVFHRRACEGKQPSLNHSLMPLFHRTAHKQRL
ncbi:MAG TPA: hypothetical protein VEW46_18330 [Pyrinomonadaceae bacterium]|nr:hypothetical protein [Pyrinomonadaceae bacterium]